MMKNEDSRAQALLTVATNQIGHALKEYGLYITIDTEGNFGIDRLPVDFPIKNERVSDRLRRVIYDGHARDRPITSIRLTDEHARKLAAELSELQFNRTTTEADIYAGLLAGGFRLMDLPVTVTPP
jgi:hypothetical protein